MDPGAGPRRDSSEAKQGFLEPTPTRHHARRPDNPHANSMQTWTQTGEPWTGPLRRRGPRESHLRGSRRSGKVLPFGTGGFTDRRIIGSADRCSLHRVGRVRAQCAARIPRTVSRTLRTANTLMSMHMSMHMSAHISRHMPIYTGSMNTASRLVSSTLCLPAPLHTRLTSTRCSSVDCLSKTREYSLTQLVKTIGWSLRLHEPACMGMNLATTELVSRNQSENYASAIPETGTRIHKSINFCCRWL